LSFIGEKNRLVLVNRVFHAMFYPKYRKYVSCIFWTKIYSSPLKDTFSLSFSSTEYSFIPDFLPLPDEIIFSGMVFSYVSGSKKLLGIYLGDKRIHSFIFNRIGK